MHILVQSCGSRGRNEHVLWAFVCGERRSMFLLGHEVLVSVRLQLRRLAPLTVVYWDHLYVCDLRPYLWLMNELHFWLLLIDRLNVFCVWFLLKQLFTAWFVRIYLRFFRNTHFLIVVKHWFCFWVNARVFVLTRDIIFFIWIVQALELSQSLRICGHLVLVAQLWFGLVHWLPDLLLQDLSENEVSKGNWVVFKLVDSISALLDNVCYELFIDALQNAHLDLPKSIVPLLLFVNLV